MENLISIATLNDFIFCPYSIYLHNIYMDTDEGEYQAFCQARGKIAHNSVDTGSGAHRSNDCFGMSIYSERYGLIGKIDVYKGKEKILIERKYQLKNIYRGQIYQLWAQYFCMTEMGYNVQKLAFYEISTKKTTYLDIPSLEDTIEFESFIELFRSYNIEDPTETAVNKCKHCIYCNMCDKTSEDNVYQ